MAKYKSKISKAERDHIHAANLSKRFDYVHMQRIAQAYDHADVLVQGGVPRSTAMATALKNEGISERLTFYQGWVAYRIMNGDLRNHMDLEGKAEREAIEWEGNLVDGLEGTPQPV